MKCLYCKKKLIQSKEAKFKPFCSERCRSLDLSNWLSEKNVISSNLNAEENYDWSLIKDIPAIPFPPWAKALGKSFFFIPPNAKHGRELKLVKELKLSQPKPDFPLLWLIGEIKR